MWHFTPSFPPSACFVLFHRSVIPLNLAANIPAGSRPSAEWKKTEQSAGPLEVTSAQCYTPEHQAPPFSKVIRLITSLLSKLYAWKVLCLSSYRLLSCLTLWGTHYVCGCKSDHTCWASLPLSPNIYGEEGRIPQFCIIAWSEFTSHFSFAVNQDENMW